MIHGLKSHSSEGFVKEARLFNPEKIKFSDPEKQPLTMDGLKNKTKQKNADLTHSTTNLMFMEEFCLVK